MLAKIKNQAKCFEHWFMIKFLIMYVIIFKLKINKKKYNYIRIILLNGEFKVSSLGRDLFIMDFVPCNNCVNDKVWSPINLTSDIVSTSR